MQGFILPAIIAAEKYSLILDNINLLDPTQNFDSQ